MFGLVIAFLALFTTFVSVTTNYSRCYKIKDEILLAIERNHGINKDSIGTINEYLNGIGYSSTGSCPTDGNCWYSFSTKQNVNSYNKPSSKNINYCISKHSVTKRTTGKDENGNDVIYTNGAIGHPDSAYYEVVVFFKLDWPILNTFFNIKISGETSVIFLLNDYDTIKKGICK